MKKYDIAAYIWPAFTGSEIRTKIFWPEGIGEWETVKRDHSKPEFNYEWNRKPLWGYEDEADPAVMEKQISEAVSHGVNVFIYDWYWYDGRPFLENCLNNGFLKAANRNDMKFYIMWANHNAGYTWDYRISGGEDVSIWRGAVDERQFREIGKRWIEKYFPLENYYRIDGKPVVSIYDMGNYINGLGGIDNTVRNMNWLREEALAAGLGGVHFQMVKWGDISLNLSGVDGGIVKVAPQLVKKLGFDSMTHYQMAHFTDVSRDFEAIIPDVEKEWQRVRNDYDIPYYPHISLGWDNNPRFKGFRPQIVTNNTPENVKKLLLKAKEFSDDNGGVPLITINSWNEWTETSYLEPDSVNGYGYLNAVRDVFAADRKTK